MLKNRSLISSWEYVKITETYSVSVFGAPSLPEEPSYTFYNESGYCFGDGEDFSDVPESFSAVIVGNKKDDSEGLELSLTL